MTEQEKLVSYAFTFNFRVGGVVDSPYSPEETQKRLEAELAVFYGADGFEIVEFREASDEEIQAYKTAMAQNELEDDVTIN